MTKTLLDGPGRVLESVHPRFLVDLAQGDDARHPQAHQQQFRERLMQELLARVQLQAWTNSGMLNAPLSLRLTLVEKLASMLDPGHLALTQIAQHLALLQKMDHRQHSAFPELPQQIAALYEWFSARCRWKEKALTQRGLLVQAGEQSEQIFTRWRAGAYNAWSLPGRCFIVLEELRWGPFRASSDLQLVPIRQLALFKEMQGVKSNKGLNEQDKLAKTTAIQAQLDDLDRLNNALSAMSSVSKAVQ